MKKHISKLNHNNIIDHILYSFTGTALIACIMACLASSLPSAHATTGTASDTKTANASVTVSATCSMTANITTAHTATLPNGIWSGASGYYPNGIGNTTIATFCNDASGYSIYAVGYTGDTMTGGNNNKLHNSQLGSSYDIATGTETSGANSQWAMKVTKVTDSSESYLPNNLTIQNGFDNANYHAVPATYTEVARYSSATDATLGSKINTTYSAYVSSAQPAGTYEGKVKYTLVHPGGSDMPDVDTMQHVDYWGGSLLVGETRTVADIRDNKTYTVARLCTNYSGDNCTSSQIWMTQNLDLEIGGTYQDGNETKDIILTSENTDLNAAGSGAYANGYSTDGNGVITWTPSGTTVTGTPATISTYASGNPTSVSGWQNENYLPYMAEAGTNVLYGVNTTPYTSVSDCVTTGGHTQTECERYQVGNFYNWTAAIASNNSQPINSQYSVASNSICPAGWRLPYGPTNPGGTVIQSEFNAMLSANSIAGGTDLTGGTNVGYADGGFSKMTSYPYNFSRFGHVYGSTMGYVGGGGFWWSSTASSGTNGYGLYMHGTELYPAYSTVRLDGFSVRCVAK